MEIRKSYLGMIKAMPGGWDAMAAALGLSRMALENRIYERKGQSVLVETALAMQHFSGTSLFADAIAQEAGGVFVALPAAGEVGNEELLTEFNRLYEELGELSKKFMASAADNNIDRGERAQLEQAAQKIHQTLQALLALMFGVYCRPDICQE